MELLNHYKEKIVKYDLINKFTYKNITNIPKLNYIILNFNLKKGETKSLIKLMSSLKLIVLQDPKITTSKTSNIVFKIRKGQPIGCQLILRNVKMNNFLFKMLNKILPKINSKKINNSSLVSFNLNNVLIFEELEYNYQFFKNLPNLSVHIKFSHCTFEEFCYLLKSYKVINK